ncbi:zona pellucida sperm-binding protein 3-like isoform X2 [Pseudochaenichthys georgianus]|uniref:zona pellucida sperm-binding protein 3-like isoform X2 n=1 Tax=Pseudochaenichthys georgianus TaxID=52239 RepID=UPI0039C39B82
MPSLKMGALLTLSFRSQFLARTQDDKLHMSIDAFRFYNEDRGELYITCHLYAVPINSTDATTKACTFVNGRWQSADGNDYFVGNAKDQLELSKLPAARASLGLEGL